MCSPKEFHQKNFRRLGVFASKKTLNTFQPTILKGGGGSKTPGLSDFSEPPPSPLGGAMALVNLQPTSCPSNAVEHKTHRLQQVGDSNIVQTY